MPRYRFADLVLDIEQLSVTRAGTPLAMGGLTYKLLVALVEAAPKVLTQDQLIAAVWNGRSTSPETVTQRVKLLRDALGDDAERPRYIRVLRNQGYQLMVPVERPDAPESIAREHAVAGLAVRKRLMGLMAAGIVAVGLLAWGSASFRGGGTASAAPVSIAVLPLANLSGDAEQQYFVDGMTEALIKSLSQLSGMSVISRTSVMPYRQTTKSLTEIARELGVEAVVEGSAQLEGSRVRITAQLIDARTDRHLWADSYDRDFAEVLRLQNEMSATIAREISVNLTPEETQRLARARTIDPDTYRAYLRGAHQLALATPDGTQRGLGYLHSAIDRDPGDALANAALSLGYATVGHGPEPRVDAWARARVTAERAILLDPYLADGHAALGVVKLYSDFDWPGAEAALRRAIELNPSLAMAHYHYAWHRALFGRWDEAIAEHRRAKELDPLNPTYTFWLGTLYVYDDFSRWREAVAEAKRALELQPDNPLALFVLGMAHTAGGRHDEAIAVHEQMVAIQPDLLWQLGTTYGKAGRLDDARRILEQVEQQPNTAWTAYGEAMLHMYLGELDPAFESLTYEPFHSWTPWAVVDPWLSPAMTQDPRFAAFRARLGL